MFCFSCFRAIGAYLYYIFVDDYDPTALSHYRITFFMRGIHIIYRFLGLYQRNWKFFNVTRSKRFEECNLDKNFAIS